MFTNKNCVCKQSYLFLLEYHSAGNLDKNVCMVKISNDTESMIARVTPPIAYCVHF